jgi:hypothetical protein
MHGLRNGSVFRFCAIPQIMAIGTLALCFDNGAVFEGTCWCFFAIAARGLCGLPIVYPAS